MNSPSGPLLAVDVGNTRIKLGLFADFNDAPIKTFAAACEALSWETLAEFAPSQPVQWRVGAVRRDIEQQLQNWITQHRPEDLYRRILAADSPLPTSVKTPEKVGVDRLLAALAAKRLRTSGRPAIVVDCGTATTVDQVSAEGVFEGGAILPGLRMMGDALTRNTDLLPPLPLRKTREKPPPLGKSTEQAMAAGVFWASVGAVRELIRQHQQPAAELFFTGGDAPAIAAEVAPEAHLEPDLVLRGLAACD